MAETSRRRFLEDSLLTAAAAAATASSRLALAGGPSPRKVSRYAPSDRVRVAVVGVNGRGMAHVAGFMKEGSVVAAVCDADRSVYGKAAKAVVEKGGKEPAYYQDVRKLLEDRSIDVISIATPNHWHALGSIWAIQAGKDVYVEKPVSHNMREGRILVEYAHKYRRIVQTGTQSRSNPGMRDFIAAVHQGKIGKVSTAVGICYRDRKSIGQVARAGGPPPDVDYDLWLGPAARRSDVPRARFHYDWHWQWDYGNGDVGNQGVHEMDKARWGLGKTTLPKSVVSLGGRFGYQDDGETPNTQLAFFDYDDAQLIFEVRGLSTQAQKGVKVGNIFYGSDGYAVSTNYTSGTLFSPDGEQTAHFDGTGDHFDNFLQAVRSRKPTDLTADIEEGHLSAALGHLANISHRLGSPVSLGTAPTANIRGGHVDDAISRMGRHLTDNGIRPDKTTIQLGRELAINPATEAFTNGGRRAEALLARVPRKGFAVPTRA